MREGVQQVRVAASRESAAVLKEKISGALTRRRYRRFFGVSSWALLCLFLVSCQGPPKERGEFRTADLVELAKLDPALRLEIRYAGTNNFLHRPVYRQARAFLQRPAAEALVRANKNLKPLGY